jgi:hypothetical protein
MAVDDLAGNRVVDLGISLLGAGEEGLVAGGLLGMDVLLPETGARLTGHPMGLHELARATEDAKRGKAPTAGLAPQWLAARLLSLPTRVSGHWPVVCVAPKEPEAVLEAVRTAVPPHLLVQGGSGQGKTTLLAQCIRDRLDAGAVIAVVDPHGDLAARAAACLEAARQTGQIVDYGNPTVVPWNLTQPDLGVDPRAWASILTSTIRQLWSGHDLSYFGPKRQRITRALLAILVRDPQGPRPLTELPVLLEDPSQPRDEALERIADPELSRIIESELIPMLRSRDPDNTVAWITAKLEPLIGDPSLASIVGVSESHLDVTRILAGEHLVVSLPPSRLTGEGSRLLGGLLVGRIWAAVKRASHQRPLHLYIDLYIDEWQHLANPVMGEMLAEGRKLGLAVRSPIRTRPRSRRNCGRRSPPTREPLSRSGPGRPTLSGWACSTRRLQPTSSPGYPAIGWLSLPGMQTSSSPRRPRTG